MSRASTLARAIGADGALNVADVAGLAAVASSGSASDLSTGTLPIARIADGAVTAAKLASTAVTDKLGYTPLNKAGDTMSGALGVGQFTYGSNSGEARLGRASDRSVGVATLQLGGTAAQKFEIVDKAWSNVVFSVQDNGVGSIANEFNTPGKRQQFYIWGQGSMSSAWVHLKTNRRTNESQMHSVFFEGYDYGAGKPILAAVGWYNYGGSDNTISIGSTGSHTINVYKSSDGYAVMAISTGAYYVGFTLSQMWTSQGIGPISISASTLSSASSGAY